MHPQAIQILEIAIALQRAPGERFRLRERPLPEGLVHVLEVASGAPTALSEAAVAMGVTEQAILEASRFYLEQVLFASPDADAYRILGVAPDASPEQIRGHHRWLQRWLHPDRAQAGDASVFATRVNQAWAQLRTPAGRHEYDVRLAEARLAGSHSPVPDEAVRHWQFEAVQTVPGRRSRWLLGAALVSCAVLAVLIVRHEEPVGSWPPGDPQFPEQAARNDAETRGAPQALVDALAKVPKQEPEQAHAPSPTTEAALPQSPSVAASASAPTVPSMPAPRPPERETAAVQLPAAPAPREKPVSAPRKMVAIPRPSPPRFEVASLAKPAPIHVAASVDPVSASPPAQPPLSTPETGLLLERMHKAEHRVAQLTAYLAAQPDAAPLWNDVRTQTAADRLRERIAGGNGARLELLAPNWRLQPDQASFSAGYRCNACRIREGRLDVELVWRAGLWLVRGVDMAPAA